MRVKKYLLAISILMLLIISACNIIPPDTPYQQVGRPQFSPTPGSHQASYVDVVITTTTPDSSIFYTIDGSIPQDMGDWLDNLNNLNSQVESNINCVQIIDELQPQVIADINEWWVIAGGTSDGQLTPQQVQNCQIFMSNFQDGYPQDMSLLLTSNFNGMSDCSAVFNFLGNVIILDNNDWRAILDEMGEDVVTSCQVIFNQMNNELPAALTSLLYVDRIRLTKPTTIRAIAHKDGLWSSDIVTAEYLINDPGTPAYLTVNAGPDQQIVFPNSAKLAGTYQYNAGTGEPTMPTFQWTKVSGPGTVTFSNSASLEPTVTVSSAGTYVLRLTGTAGTLTSTDTVTLTFTAPLNQPPWIIIKTPSNGSVITQNSVFFEVEAEDPNGFITKIEFFRDEGVKIGEINSSLLREFTWQNVSAGKYTITARAHDNQGANTTSDPIEITVQLDPTNQLPIVKIVYPHPAQDSSRDDPIKGFTENQNISVIVNASDPDGSIAKIEFQVNGKILEERTFNTEPTAVSTTFFWKAEKGKHELAARAYDNLQASVLSDKVVLEVATIPPPPGGGGSTGGSGGGGGGGGGGGLPPPPTNTSNGSQTTGGTQPGGTTGTPGTFTPPADQTGNQEQPGSEEIFWGEESESETSIMNIIYIVVGIILVGGLIAFFVISRKRDYHEHVQEIHNPGIPETNLLQVKGYIDKLKGMGKSSTEIRDKLKTAGWNDEQLDYVFQKFG